MKIHVLLASLLIGGSAIAQTTPSTKPTPFQLPVIPPTVNSAAYATPKLDWVERINATNAQAQKRAATITLVFDGDSITDYWSTQARGKEIWDSRYAKLGAINFGIGGDRTQHVLWRLDQGQVDGLNPKLIALMIGTNNLYRNTDDQIIEGVKAIIDRYQKSCPNSVILLQAIFPRGQAPTDPARAKIKTINQGIAKFADGQKIIFIDFGDKFLSADGSIATDIMPDFLHPTAKGYQIWADAIQPIIDQYCPAK